MKKLKIQIMLAISVLICILMPVQAYAAIPDEDILDRFNSSNIFYYNPSGSDCKVGSTHLNGNTTEEKIWNYLIDKGFNDAQVAGILGNAKLESGLEPTISPSGNYFGLFQAYVGYHAKLFEMIRENGLEKYLAPEYADYGGSEKIPTEDLDKLIIIQLDYILSDEFSEWQNAIKNAQSPEEAAEIFLVHYERAIYVAEYSDICNPIMYYQDYMGVLYQATSQRRNYAREFYEQYSGHGTVSTGSKNETGKNITIIGDSITVGATTNFKEVFPDLADEDIDARISRTWSEGIEIAKNMNKKSVVIFALGSNTNNLNEDDIREAITTIGTGKTIVFVTNYDNNSTYISNNELLRKFAKDYSNILLADWAAAVKDEPEKYLASDYIHPNQEGSKLFVDTIKKIIDGNVSNSSCTGSVSGEFAEKVLAYAWPTFHPADFTELMPAYKEAVAAHQKAGSYVGGGAYPGVDCGGFVTILVQDSGLEPNYNTNDNGLGGGTVISQHAWVKSHGWTLLNDSENSPIDTSILQPGDIAFTTNDNHTFIYVGNINGFDSVIASASYLIWRAPMAGTEDLVSDGSTYVKWYRNPNIDMQKNTSYTSKIKD